MKRLLRVLAGAAFAAAFVAIYAFDGDDWHLALGVLGGAAIAVGSWSRPPAKPIDPRARPRTVHPLPAVLVVALGVLAIPWFVFALKLELSFEAALWGVFLAGAAMSRWYRPRPATHLLPWYRRLLHREPPEPPASPAATYRTP